MKRTQFTNPVMQILTAILLGVLLGHFRPALALQGQFLGEWFIAAIRMLAVPIVFLTVSLGIASVGGARHVGRLGVKTLVVFEVMSTLALLTGLAAALVFEPGSGFPADAIPAAKTGSRLAAVSNSTAPEALAQSVYRVLAGNVILQTLMLACLCGLVLAAWRNKAAGFAQWCERCTGVLLKLLAFLMLLAPIAAFSAVAFAVAKFGVASLRPLASFY
jgi:aerobic C4-dicarboxylate transport protein